MMRVAIELAPLAIPFLLAFTKKQRNSIVYERDDGQCQYPVYRERGKQNCGTGDLDKPLNLHHIEPQRVGKNRGLPRSQRDQPENALTLCDYHHNKVTHPDMQDCLSDYGRQKKLGIKKPDSFNHLFKKRDEKIKNGEKYWNDEMDEAFREIAQDRTDYKRTKGWVFPKKTK